MQAQLKRFWARLCLLGVRCWLAVPTPVLAESGDYTIAQVPAAQFSDAAKTLTPDGEEKAQAGQRQCHAPIYFITAVTPGNTAGSAGLLPRRSASRHPPYGRCSSMRSAWLAMPTKRAPWRAALP